jgi:hypothetical protein
MGELRNNSPECQPHVIVATMPMPATAAALYGSIEAAALEALCNRDDRNAASYARTIIVGAIEPTQLPRPIVPTTTPKKKEISG